MHSFLRAIGFSKIRTKQEESEIINRALQYPSTQHITTIGVNSSLAQVNYEICRGIGISVVGEYDSDNTFLQEHYFPYIEPTVFATQEQLQIEKHADKEAYSGICENMNVGVSLIFYLQNIAQYIRTKWSNSYADTIKDVAFSGLSIEGRILLPIEKNEQQLQRERLGQNNRNNLIAAAKAGDAEAIESLTLEDIDLYTNISKRTKTEDILSIIDTYIIPYGIESEQYSILGNIIGCKLVTNTITKEQLYQLQLDCNDIIIDMCINVADLLGEPLIGRRFKGTLWLQGYVTL